MSDDDLLGDQTLPTAFDGDLLTEYVPDALGAADIRCRLARGATPADDGTFHVGRLRVPLARRTEAIPVASCALRAKMFILTEQALAGYVPRPEVFSYRSLGWQYRVAHKARRRYLQTLAIREDLPLVLVLDVHRFGQSLPLRALMDAPWMTERLADALTDLQVAAGRGLLPGHRWSNRLATAVLAPLDDAVAALAPDRWARWGDDVHVFTRDHAEADEIRAAVAGVLNQLGLRLAPEKSTVVTADSVFDGPARTVVGLPQEVWRTGLATGDVTALRYALPRTPPDDAVSRTLVDAVQNRPVLLPRAVDYLDRAAHTSSGQAAAKGLLHATEADEFTAARLLALVARHPTLVSELPNRLTALATDSEFVPLRELAFRVDVLRDARTACPPTDRLRKWLHFGDFTRYQQPQVATLL